MLAAPVVLRQTCDACGRLGTNSRTRKTRKGVGVLGGFAITFTVLGLLSGLASACVYAAYLSDAGLARHDRMLLDEEGSKLRDLGLTEDQIKRRLAGEWLGSEDLVNIPVETHQEVNHSSARLGYIRGASGVGRIVPAAIAALFFLAAVVTLLPGGIMLLIWRRRPQPCRRCHA